MIPQTPQIAMSAKKENDVMGLCLRERIRHSIFLCLALVTMFSLFLLTTGNVHANPVTLDDQAGVLNVEGCSYTIDDEAGVLDAGRVQAEMYYCMLIYTTDRFIGDQNALNTYTRERLPNQDTIAIGIDTVHRNLSIEAGTNLSLSNSQASDAVSAFQNNYHGGDYTSATIAAIDSVQNALNSGGGFNPFIPFLLVIAILIIGTAGMAVVVNAMRWRGTGSFWGGSYDSGGHGGGGGHG